MMVNEHLEASVLTHKGTLRLYSDDDTRLQGLHNVTVVVLALLHPEFEFSREY